ncbi:MAG: 1-(5-phosphoribosyl)-5-[(5-phosphoribosylamino)methylideneamino]imidazole-4-carboxamide isomerase [Coriobacteriales bacterium]|jgi:phosphoribosylformimino-5-aminoimidazole carboxamide ribotide isomerase|nr:1-(5-phosphoribosyl)-5-[(5-phosphoribosylamino)methylideneamino]imidazole-4-carboxamide isomerase [Coriobacteriales bacterium]
MKLLPAIDLLNGQVVRLAQGRYDQATVYNYHPVAQALTFKAAGVEWLHVVDLNGARSGEPENLPLIRDIVSESGLKVEVGGGIRTFDTIDSLLRAGVARVVLGTMLVSDPGFAREASLRYGDQVCAGVDAKDGEAEISGWEQDSGQDATSLVRQLADIGIKHLVYTDIARDGLQVGVDPEAYRKIAEAAGFPVVASGGIGSLDDLRALAALGTERIEGVIVGRALYERSFTVEQALEALA